MSPAPGIREVRVLQALMERGRAGGDRTPAALAADLGLETEEVSELIGHLERLGFVAPVGGGATRSWVALNEMGERVEQR